MISDSIDNNTPDATRWTNEVKAASI